MNKQWLFSAMAASGIAGFLHAVSAHADTVKPKTPIEHVIIIMGENHAFDNVFGAYKPPKGQKVRNLLSQGIIDKHGNPGEHFDKAAQYKALGSGNYSISPELASPYDVLPQPNTTYATGQPGSVPDPRFPADLPNGPYQLTKYAAYSDYVGDPIHRFFQMWQQINKGKNDLFVWVANTAGIGNHNDSFGTTPDDTFQGSLAMGFYNTNEGDAPYFKFMAKHYAMSDNYHQSIMGGTGANFIAIATGDAGYYNIDGTPTMPPTSVVDSEFGKDILVSQIENPEPQPGLPNPNWYSEDGYRGGSYVKCADKSEPGVAPIHDYLDSLQVKHNCANDTYYLVNNYNPGYTPDGKLVDLKAKPFSLPPQPGSVPTIAEALAAKGVSWKWYSGGRGKDGSSPTAEYCSICDPFSFYTAVMTSDLKKNLQDVTEFYKDVKKTETLPAVAFVRPFESMAGHPANASIVGFENFVTNLINLVHKNEDLWKTTAILITMDEGGGYYDSGYIQPVDFFGDGTRIPMIAVSPYAKKGYVDHTYYDHASILKFIEKNWDLQPLSKRSRDNLPNPVHDQDAYIPANIPAVGDLMNLFDFSKLRGKAPAIRISTKG